MAKFSPPENFDFCRPVAWPEWRERFLRFRKASKLHKEDNDVQVSTLIYAMGPEAEKIFQSFTFADGEDNNNFDTVLTKFNEHFIPRRNILHERARFYSRAQHAGESVEQFVRSLRDLAAHCDFQDKEEEAVRDRLVIGLLDKDVSQKLQLEELSTLTLKSAADTARHYELVKSQQGNADVHAVHSHNPRGRHSRRPGSVQAARGDGKKSNRGDTCGNCGRSHESGKCPARGKRCKKCTKYNHFAAVCRSKAVNTVDSEHLNTDTVEHFYMSEIKHEAVEPPWHVKLGMAGHQIVFKIDTGADVSVISREEFSRINPRPELLQSKAVLRGPGGMICHDGEFRTSVTHRQQECSIRCFVVNKAENLLSREAATRLHLVQRLDRIEAPYSDPLFSELDEHPAKCPPVQITLDGNHTPYSVATARRVPIPLMEKVKKELDRLKSANIIESVEEPTDWCAPIVPVQKKDGSVRICTDYKQLNKAVKRERYQLPTLEDILHRLRGAKVFSKLDCASGFFQIPLEPASCKLTTFITPFGRYLYKRLPQGITSAPEIFQRTVESVLKDNANVVVYFDDILVYSENDADHAKHLEDATKKLRDTGFKLNQGKCQYHMSEIEFLGYLISGNGICIDPAKVKAIVDMEAPQDITEARRFIGMVNFLGRHLENLSTVMQPIIKLLEKDTAWGWGPQQEAAFKNIKEMLTSAPTLAFYDPGRATIVSSDASSYGIGGVLLQQQDDSSWRPVAFCSRTLTATEKRYAQIEKECLAAVWSCERFDRYLVGLPSFLIETDHKPLVPLINTRSLTETPLRCQRMLMRLARFNVQAQYTPGKNMYVADQLSRQPSSESANENSLQNDITEHVSSVESSWPASDAFLDKIKTETARDERLSIAVDYTIHGWPVYKEDVKIGARHLFQLRSELSVCDGLLLRGDRIVIPPSLQKELLGRVHQGHFGISKCRARAATCMWWPGMSKDIGDLISRCRFCQEKQPSQMREPLLPTPLPDRPFQQMAADLCEQNGQHYLVVVDYFSRYLDICHLTKTTSDAVIGNLKNIFARHGVPELLISDNGPQFTSAEFQHFAEVWNFRHATSSPHYPQANGAAERAVRTAKHILKQEDTFMALLTYRATTLPELGLSPAELAFNRKLRTTLPTLPRILSPQSVDVPLLSARHNAYKQRQKQHFDRHHGARHLPALSPGDPVHVKLDGQKGWKQQANVVGPCARRSYLLRTPEGGEIRRNRRHIRPFQDSIPQQLSSPQDQPATSKPGAAATTPAVPEVPAPLTPQKPPTPACVPDPGPVPITDQSPQQMIQPSAAFSRCGRQIKPPVRFKDYE